MQRENDLPEMSIVLLKKTIGIFNEDRQTGFQNHYLAAGEDVAICRKMVSMGLMIESPPRIGFHGKNCFHATKHGFGLASSIK